MDVPYPVKAHDPERDRHGDDCKIRMRRNRLRTGDGGHHVHGPRRTGEPLCTTERDGPATRALRTPGPLSALGPGGRQARRDRRRSQPCRRTAPTATSTRFQKRDQRRRLPEGTVGLHWREYHGTFRAIPMAGHRLLMPCRRALASRSRGAGRDSRAQPFSCHSQRGIALEEI